MYNAIEVLASGLSVARSRVNTLSSNIANAETTRTPEGGPYKRLDIVQSAIPIQSRFSNTLDRMTLARPQLQAVVADASEPRQVFKPGHPDANEMGFVSMPNVNVVTTMTDLMSATRLYQANVTALENTRKMGQAAARISIRF